jgi:raffinose/stachyose/melibiose transport system permease protein
MIKKQKSIWYLSAFFIFLIHMIPFYILVNIAFKSPTDSTSKWIPPIYLYISNFTNAWKSANLGSALINNILIVVCSVTFIIIFGASAGYPLARIKTRFNTVIYFFIVSCMIVPALTVLVPLYKFMVDIKAMNTLQGVILIHISFFLPISIFLYTGFIRTIPKELDEAAMIDGANAFQVFFKIILPLLKPVTATIIILTGVGIWNDYQFSLFFLQKRSVQTITVSLAQFFAQFESEIGWVAAGCLICSIPLAMMYLFLQKYFIKGLSAGAVKG